MELHWGAAGPSTVASDDEAVCMDDDEEALEPAEMTVMASAWLGFLTERALLLGSDSGKLVLVWEVRMFLSLEPAP